MINYEDYVPPAPGDALHVMHGQYRPVCSSATDCVEKCHSYTGNSYHREKNPSVTLCGLIKEERVLIVLTTLQFIIKTMK